MWHLHLHRHSRCFLCSKRHCCHKNTAGFELTSIKVTVIAKKRQRKRMYSTSESTASTLHPMCNASKQHTVSWFTHLLCQLKLHQPSKDIAPRPCVHDPNPPDVFLLMLLRVKGSPSVPLSLNTRVCTSCMHAKQQRTERFTFCKASH